MATNDVAISLRANHRQRDGNHDDLVLALALACCFGEKKPPLSVPATSRWRQSAWR
jgi:hypothetical protein